MFVQKSNRWFLSKKKLIIQCWSHLPPTECMWNGDMRTSPSSKWERKNQKCDRQTNRRITALLHDPHCRVGHNKCLLWHLFYFTCVDSFREINMNIIMTVFHLCVFHQLRDRVPHTGAHNMQESASLTARWTWPQSNWWNYDA